MESDHENLVKEHLTNRISQLTKQVHRLHIILCTLGQKKYFVLCS